MYSISSISSQKSSLTNSSSNAQFGASSSLIGQNQIQFKTNLNPQITIIDPFKFIEPTNISPSIKDFCKMAILLSCQPQYKTFNDMAKLIADKFNERFGGIWGVSIIKMGCGCTCFSSNPSLRYIIQYVGLEYYLFQTEYQSLPQPLPNTQVLVYTTSPYASTSMGLVGNKNESKGTPSIVGTQTLPLIDNFL